MMIPQYLQQLMNYTTTPQSPVFEPESNTLFDELDVVGSPMGVPPMLSQAGIEPLAASALEPVSPGPGLMPQIIQAEGPVGPHEALTPKRGLWDKMIDGAPVFGMDRLSRDSRKDAIMAGLMRFGSSMMGGVQPGQQNLIGDLGDSLDYGLSGYQDTLQVADRARLAENSQQFDRRRQQHLIDRDNREDESYAKANAAAAAERERVFSNLTPEQKAKIDPFLGADDKTFYASLGRVLTAPEGDTTLRSEGGKLYRVPDEGNAELVGGIDYTEGKGDDGYSGPDIGKIMSEARAMAKIELDQAEDKEDRAREFAEDTGSSYYNRTPDNKFDLLVKKWVGQLKEEYGYKKGGTSTTAQTGPEAEAEAAGVDLDAGIDGLGLPPETAAQWKKIAADLKAQGKSDEEIAALIDSALSSGGGG